MGTLLINSVKVKTYKNLFYKMKTSAIFCASAFLGVSVNAVSEDICIRVVTGSDAHSEATGLDFIKATFLNDANEEIDVVDFELGPFRTGGVDIICNTANLAGNSKDSVSYKMQIHRSSTDGKKLLHFKVISVMNLQNGLILILLNFGQMVILMQVTQVMQLV